MNPRLSRTLARTLGGFALGVAALLLTAAQPRAEAPAVVVSIKPLHGLVSGVMAGVGTPELLIDGAASPHGYSLRPSDARALQEADLVVLVGEALESFLEGPLRTLSADARLLRAAALPGVDTLPVRSGDAWEGHGHDHGHDHGHGQEDDHGAEAAQGHDEETHDDHDHGGAAARADDHDHDHGDAHVHGHDEAHEKEHEEGHEANYDAHLWLDPDNAGAIAEGVAAALIELDPANAAAYRANAAALVGRIAALDRRLADALAPIADRPYIVFHDAYQYLERHYGLNAVGAITLAPERSPGARRLAEIRQRIRDSGAVCVFREPQFEPKLVETVIEGTDTRVGVLDPLGAGLPAGAESYFTLMEELGQSLRDCLTTAS